VLTASEHKREEVKKNRTGPHVLDHGLCLKLTSRDQCRPVCEGETLSHWVLKLGRQCIAKQVIECLAENRVLREEIANQRMSSTDQRRDRLARNAERLSQCSARHTVKVNSEDEVCVEPWLGKRKNNERDGISEVAETTIVTQMSPDHHGNVMTCFSCGF
jgi:hypothetical protein